MMGILFRLGTRLKDWGGRLKWVWLINLGLETRMFVFRHWEVENGKFHFKVR